MERLKRIHLFFCLILIYPVVQVKAQNRLDVSVFNNKKIISIIETSSQSKKMEDNQKNASTNVVIGENISKTLRKQEFIIKPQGSNSIIDFQVTKIKIETNTRGIENNYDSDNAFERNEFAAALGNQYDPYIKKTISLKCDQSGNITDTLSKNVTLKKIESKIIPNFSKNKIFSSIFINSPDSFIWKENKTWTDSLSIDGSFSVNQYEVQNIKSNIAIIKINGFSIPPKPSGIKYGTKQDGTNTDLITKYEGTILVDLKSNFITEINLNKQTESEIKLMNFTTKSLSETKINLKNTISK